MEGFGVLCAGHGWWWQGSRLCWVGTTWIKCQPYQACKPVICEALFFVCVVVVVLQIASEAVLHVSMFDRLVCEWYDQQYWQQLVAVFFLQWVRNVSKSCYNSWSRICSRVWSRNTLNGVYQWLLLNTSYFWLLKGRNKQQEHCNNTMSFQNMAF